MASELTVKRLQKMITETQQLMDKCANPDALDVEIHASWLVQAFTELLSYRQAGREQKPVAYLTWHYGMRAIDNDNLIEGKTMQNETLSPERLSVIAKDVAGLVDFYGWNLSAAKATFQNRTGIVIKARSKDDFVNALRNYYL